MIYLVGIKDDATRSVSAVLGPYGDEDPFRIKRGTLFLREVHDSAEVYAVEAEDEAKARRKVRRK